MPSPARPEDLQHVPRLSSRVLPRPALLAQLDGPAPLVVLRAPGGTGKTTLMAQWAVSRAPDRRGALLWVEADDGTRTRTGFWMRVLGRLHARELLSDRALYREMASIADRPDTIPAMLCRVLEHHGEPVTLLLDDVGSPDDGFWDEVCEDLREVLRRIPRLRVVLAGRFPTSLETARSRGVVDTHVVTAAELALDEEEIATLLDLTLPALRQDPRRAEVLRQLAADPAQRRLGAVRWALGVLEDALGEAPDGSALDLEALLVPALRHELRTRHDDAALREVLAVTALAPQLDVDLARRLTGREDVESILCSLEQLGMGQWLHTADGAPALFRYAHHVRRAALQDAPPASPEQRRRRHAMIAHWLAEDRGEPLAAVGHALRAEDLAQVEQLLLRAWPVSAEDARRVSQQLRTLPAARLHLHPLLALWQAMVLNSSADTQAEALPFFLSAAVVGRVRSPSTPPVERALRRGLESAVQRMLGRELAQQALPVLHEAVADPARDRGLDGVLFTAVSQSATSLFYADELDDALAARALQHRLAADLDVAHQGNVAAAHTAMIHVVRGDLVATRTALGRITAQDWPHTWRDSYHDSPEIIARAWAALNDARPAEALAQLDRLEAHVATIEHWDLIATARALALGLSGRPEEGEVGLSRTITERVTERTLPAPRRRLAAAQGVLRILADAVPAPGRRPTGRRTDPVAAALAVWRVLAEGRPEEATALLARAELAAASPFARMMTALAGVHLAHRTARGEDLAVHGLALQEIASATGLRLPLALLPAEDRQAVLEALTATGRGASAEALAAVLEAAPAASPAAAPRTAPTLSARERDVLHALARTPHRSEIAAELFVSVNTVKAHLRTLYAKLEATSREEALAAALRHGLLRREDPAGPDEE